MSDASAERIIVIRARNVRSEDVDALAFWSTYCIQDPRNKNSIGEFSLFHISFNSDTLTSNRLKVIS